MGGLQLYSHPDPNTGLNQYLIDEQFAQNLSQTNITSYGDAISVHAYPWGESQQTYEQAYTNSLQYYKSLFPSSSFWVTETGKPTEENGVNGQALYLTNALQFFQGKVSNVFWYSLHDNFDEVNRRDINNNPIPQHFGLIGDNGIARSAYSKMQNYITPG